MDKATAELEYKAFDKALKATGADPLLLTTVFATSDFMKSLATTDTHLACAFIFRVLSRHQTYEMTKLFMNSDAMRQYSAANPQGACDYMLAAITNIRYADIRTEDRIDCVRSVLSSNAFKTWAAADEQGAFIFMRDISFVLPKDVKVPVIALCLDHPLTKAVTLGAEDVMFGYATDDFFKRIPKDDRAPVIRIFVNGDLVKTGTALDAEATCRYLFRMMLFLPVPERGAFFDDYKTSEAMLALHAADKIKAWDYLERTAQFMPQAEGELKMAQLEPMRPAERAIKPPTSAPLPVA